MKIALLAIGAACLLAIPLLAARKGYDIVVAAADSPDKSRADYICDGVDDQVEINEALSALPNVGGMLLLKREKYIIRNKIIIPKSNITIMGEEGTVLEMASDFVTEMWYNEMMYVENLNNIIIENLNFVCKKSIFESMAIYFIKISNSTIRNCTFRDTVSSGIMIDEGIYDLIEKNSFSNCKTCIAVQSITQAESNYINIIGNSFSDSGRSITLTGDRNMVLGNISNNAGYYYLKVAETKISGNTIMNSSYHGIIHYKARYTWIPNYMHNIIENNTISGCNGDGIFFDGGVLNTVRNNIITNNTGYGINLSSMICEINEVYGNTLTGNIMGAINDEGNANTVYGNT